MNTKIKFLEIMLSDLVSHRDTLELELNRVLNDDDSAVKEKKVLCNELNIELKLVPRTIPKFLKPTSSTEIINKKWQNIKLQ